MNLCPEAIIGSNGLNTGNVGTIFSTGATSVQSVAILVRLARPVLEGNSARISGLQPTGEFREN